MVRLIWLQVSPLNYPIHGQRIASESWKRAAVSQRTKSLQLDDGRAVFLDQNKQLISTERYSTIVFYPSNHWKSDSGQLKNRMAQLLNQSTKQFSDWLASLSEPSFLLDEQQLPLALSETQLIQLQHIKQNGFTIVPYSSRNGHNKSYQHIIGYVAENPVLVASHYQDQMQKKREWHLNMRIGVLGLERSFDQYLHGAGSTKIAYTMDGKNQILDGIGVHIINSNNRYYPLQVITTINNEMQNYISKLMDDANIAEGAIVVLDRDTGDIQAMVSKPDLNPSLFKNMEHSGWRNHAITANTPGSIYKIVTTAAALEFGVVDEKETFHCDGEYGKYGLSCWKKEGHGTQTLAEAFMNSCNVVFASIGERLEPQQLIQTAEALGVVHPVGWHEDNKFSPFNRPLRMMLEEEPGITLFQKDLRDGGIMAQTAIGQRDVKITPLQSANMLVTILNYGNQHETRVVSELQYADGVQLAYFPVHNGHEHHFQIHPQTAQTLMNYMERVVREGTGRQLNKSPIKYAGKTGTAQLDGELVGKNNQWFIGYGPVEHPRYSVAVLVKKANSGEANQAITLFDKTMNFILQSEIK